MDGFCFYYYYLFMVGGHQGDWGLLDYRNKKILRSKILFPDFKALYYAVSIMDLALRAAWVFSISPFVVNS